MREPAKVEIAVGLFVLLGTAGLVYLSVSIGGALLWPSDRYSLHARFATVGDLAPGAIVKLAGVPVGEVASVVLDNYAARVELRIQRELKLPRDTIASIKTSGLLGEAYVSLSPGAAEHDLGEGDSIAQTEAPLDLFELIGKYAFESDDDDDVSDPLE
jgi:phospholipid/cholesterol/gamma-HCH transport system substrate-binding protein